MADLKLTKQEMAKFTRLIVLLFNRATMYQVDHPFVKQTIDDFHHDITRFLESTSPLVFIMHHEQLYLDEEALDPRINVGRIVSYFKKVGVQSVCFEKGLTKNEIRTFLGVFTSVEKYPVVEAMQKALVTKGVGHVKLNHVRYEKVTDEEQVVSQDVLEKMTIKTSEDEENSYKRALMDKMLESVVTEELAGTLTVKNLMNDPGGLSTEMIQTDLNQSLHNETAAQPGLALLQQLQVIGEEVRSALSDSQEADLPRLASAAFEMKRRLFEDMEAKKASSIAYAGEEAIHQKADGITDEIVLQLIREKYQPGRTGTGELLETLREIVPDPQELKRLRAKIKTVLVEKNLTMDSLMKNPSKLSKWMVESDLACAGSEAEAAPGGALVLRHLGIVDEEVTKALATEGEYSLPDIAQALLEMKSRLKEEIEEQKTLSAGFSNEKAILDKADELTDKVLVKIIKDEYQKGGVSTARLGQILRRLVPEPQELKRLLPKIKLALLEEGMPLPEYLNLIKELRKELQNEELANILQESLEQTGINGDELLEGVRRDPEQMAELIYIASELGKSGDDKALVDHLVSYVEQLGCQLNKEFGSDNQEDARGRLERVIQRLESIIMQRSDAPEARTAFLERLQERLDTRIDQVFEKVKSEWIGSRSGQGKSGYGSDLSVLQVLEQSIWGSEELTEILETIRSKAQSGELDENDFSQIYEEIKKEQQKRKDREASKEIPAGIVKPQTLKIFVEKEILRASRYCVPFAVLAFSLVKAESESGETTTDDSVPSADMMNAILEKLSTLVRDCDIVGKWGKDVVIALLPMTSFSGARTALKRTLKRLHVEPLRIGEISFTLKIAGVAATYDAAKMSGVDDFFESLLNKLSHMTVRIKNIQAYF